MGRTRKTAYGSVMDTTELLGSTVKKHTVPTLEFQSLLTIDSLGDIPGLTIILETGTISRLDYVGVHL